MSEENSFFIKVYNVVRQIPEGKVTSYGAIAKYLGSPQSSRMVGWAMNASHSLCLLYTSPSPRDLSTSRMPSSA